ncbi:MAG: GNAT family N-acetyltransferase, partial [Psychrobacter faecalis]
MIKIVPLFIAPLSKADYDAWLKLWQNYLTFYETRLPPSTTEKTWRNLLDDDMPIYGFGAWQDEMLVGITHVVLHPNTWNTTECCYLEDLYVSEAVRG